MRSAMSSLGLVFAACCLLPCRGALAQQSGDSGQATKPTSDRGWATSNSDGANHGPAFPGTVYRDLVLNQA
jgi:hypothetical protein